MNEQEWMSCDDPKSVLRSMKGQTSERKLRLFAVSLHRQVLGESLAGPVRRAVVMAEQFADGLTNASRLRAAELAAHVEMFSGEWMTTENFSAYSVTRNPLDATNIEMLLMATLSGRDDIKTIQAVSNLLRDIFGNPFRPPSVDPNWLTSTVLTLAEGIYQDRAFDRLPILADALQDAGCDKEDVLSHCRSEGPHVRGCFVVDLILGKK